MIHLRGVGEKHQARAPGNDRGHRFAQGFEVFGKRPAVNGNPQDFHAALLQLFEKAPVGDAVFLDGDALIAQVKGPYLDWDALSPLAALAAGVGGLLTTPREEEPQIRVPMIDVAVGLPGAAPREVERRVVEPLERAIWEVSGVEYVYSAAQHDGALVTARFKVGTSADTAILRVRDKVLANMDRIPVGIPAPLIVGRGINDVAIVDLTLTGKPGADVSADDLTRIAKALRTVPVVLDIAERTRARALPDAWLTPNATTKAARAAATAIPICRGCMGSP